MTENKGNVCPVCGEHYFDIYTEYDDCPICGWVDDPVQRMNHDYENGFNVWSVNQAKYTWKHERKNSWKEDWRG